MEGDKGSEKSSKRITTHTKKGGAQNDIENGFIKCAPRSQPSKQAPDAEQENEHAVPVKP